MFALSSPMRRLAATLCTTSLILGSAMAQATHSPPGPEGRWLSANGNVEVDVSHCGPAWCGTITRVLSQHSMSRPGEVMTPVDTRPALGMTILKDFVPDDADEGSAPNAWRGHIYNRENGKTYRCLMSMDASGSLVLRPYVGLPLFGQTQVWRRVDATTATPANSTKEAQR
jgi:uncharacterized protein (DUF2147 family)